MTTREEAIRLAFANDATIESYTDDRVYSASDSRVGKNGMTQELLLQPDVVGIQPGIYISMSTDNNMGQADRSIRALRVFFNVYYYQNVGYGVTEALRLRGRELLDRQQIQYTEPSGEWVMMILWRGDLIRLKDEGMGDASMERSRYEMHITRQ